MANMLDYLSWRGDIPLSQSTFNAADNVIFAQLSYLPFEGIVPGIDNNETISLELAARIFDEKAKDETSDFKSKIMFEEDPELIKALGASKRFGGCYLTGYVNYIDTKLEIQFSAICILTDDNSCYLAFRGTDLTLVGWKEDFNMCFTPEIPAQKEAFKYIDKITPYIKGPLRIGGHSKGGNLAIYAAAKCDKKLQKRITDVYNNDAPGFHEDFIKSAEYNAIKSRIRSYVPQFSVIGMLLEHPDDYNVIKSSQKGLLQHDLYSWEMTYNDLVHVDEVTSGSRFVNKMLKDWLYSLNIDQRKHFINTLYSIISSSDVKSLPEIERSWLKVTGSILKTLNNTDKVTRNMIRDTLMELVHSAMNNIEILKKEPFDKQLVKQQPRRKLEPKVQRGIKSSPQIKKSTKVNGNKRKPSVQRGKN